MTRKSARSGRIVLTKSLHDFTNLSNTERLLEKIRDPKIVQLRRYTLQAEPAHKHNLRFRLNRPNRSDSFVAVHSRHDPIHENNPVTRWITFHALDRFESVTGGVGAHSTTVVLHLNKNVFSRRERRSAE